MNMTPSNRGNGVSMTDEELARCVAESEAAAATAIIDAKTIPEEEPPQDELFPLGDLTLFPSGRIEVNGVPDSEGREPVCLERRGTGWSAICVGRVANGMRGWEIEPPMAARSEDFMARTRFATVALAAEAAVRAGYPVLPWRDVHGERSRK